ncbi:3,5-dihydroxyphenylacetyl-CoA synthase DpgA [Micromonospora tarapacensis]|uniref:3,5-dihydroxyphenylacetyl-CoA synthase DpgA n=1 Tax=Micromonospora tarapacensis TaxID=2835305 RepID=UPI002F3E7F3E
MTVHLQPATAAPHGTATISEFDRRSPRILGFGTAVPSTSYTQTQLLHLFGIADPRVRSVFANSAIDRRFLTLPPAGPDGARQLETQGQLLHKHREQTVDMGARALESCLKHINAQLTDVRYLCCVTSTGFLTPGVSALLIRELGLEADCARLDVVGMGCNAGLNGLTATAAWAAAKPGELAILLCVEACSAAYVMDGTMRTSVVNSLFGDGAAAIAVRSDDSGERSGPQLLRFTSLIIPEAVGAMRYDWDDTAGKFSFYLDRDIPYVVGAHAERAIDALLAGTGVRRGDIAHWVIHPGGKKVIDSVMVNLGLTRHDVRHTAGVLREYGNVSSASFLFAYARLAEEEIIAPGEYGVLMTMGPGTTIETALVRW